MVAAAGAHDAAHGCCATRVLVLWCRDWPVVAAGAAPSDLVAVVHAGRVVACSAAARAEGVTPGLRRREAQARCPGIELVPHDPARDARAFEPVLAALEALTPWVEVLAPGEAAFPARGAARYHGGEAALAAKVAAAVEEVLAGRGGQVGIGIADGVFAASLAARSAATSRDLAAPRGPVAVRGGSALRGAGVPQDDDAGGPAAGRGQAGVSPAVIVPPGGSPAFLAPFPVRVLGQPDLAGLLGRLGLRTLGDLAALPRASVAARFGPEGARAHRLAGGLDEQPRAARRPPPDLAVAAELDPPAERVDVAAFAAKALADELAERLDRLGLACTSLRIEAETEHGESLSRRWRLPDEGPRVAAMVERVRWQLDGWLAGGAGGPGELRRQAPATTSGGLGPPSGGLTKLLLAPEQVAPEHGRQLGFWGEQRAAGQRAARGLARLQGLLGADAVRIARLRGGRGPADQVAFVSAGEDGEDGESATGPAAIPGAGAVRPRGRSRARAKRAAAPWPGRLRAPSPTIVHPEPQAAEVLDGDGAPVTVSGRGLLSAPPAALRPWGAAPGAAPGPARITAWAGPWPVDERWWDPRSHRRAARLQVLTSQGTAHLLKLADGRWWIEANYD